MLRPYWTYTSRAVRGALSLVGAAALVLAVMIAIPVKTPPELPSISSSARGIDRSALPQVQRFQARDGTELGHRIYLPDGAPKRAIILVHGSSGNGTVMNVLGRELAKGGVLAIAVDIRGHGVSGTRGDISYFGQLEDDLEDLVAHVKRSYPDVPFALAGHSSGGGFALRVAAGTKAALFDRYILLAPYLGPNAVSSRQQTGTARWAEPDIPRIIGLTMLRKLGITCCEHLPVLAFATAPGAELRQTTRYSFRLLANFGTDALASPPFDKVRVPLTVISGEQDELMDAARYREIVEAPGRPASVVLIPDLDHMQVLGDARTVRAMEKVLLQ